MGSTCSPMDTQQEQSAHMSTLFTQHVEQCQEYIQKRDTFISELELASLVDGHLSEESYLILLLTGSNLAIKGNDFLNA